MTVAPLLLDTHYWLWLELAAKGRIQPKIRKAIDDAAAAGNLLLSVISVWEVAMLEAKARIHLHLPCAEWVKQALAPPGPFIAPLTPEIAVESSRLPGSFHGDPADRIIVATARALHARVLTADDKILDYGAHKHVLIFGSRG